jgi:hypothetical protein
VGPIHDGLCARRLKYLATSEILQTRCVQRMDGPTSWQNTGLAVGGVFYLGVARAQPHARTSLNLSTTARLVGLCNTTGIAAGGCTKVPIRRRRRVQDHSLCTTDLCHVVLPYTRFVRAELREHHLHRPCLALSFFVVLVVAEYKTVCLGHAMAIRDSQQIPDSIQARPLPYSSTVYTLVFSACRILVGLTNPCTCRASEPLVEKP